MISDREQVEAARPSDEDIAERLKDTRGKCLVLQDDGRWLDVVNGAVADSWQDLLS